MEKKSSCSFTKALFSVGKPVPGTPLVFLLVAIVSTLQIPANLLMKSFSFNVGILINEIFIIVGIPLVIAHYLNFDRSRLFVFKIPTAKSWMLATLLAIPAAFMIDYAAAASELILPMPQHYHELLNRLMAFEGKWQFVVKLFVLAVLPGTCEEIFFRGLCQTSLEVKWGKNIAIFLTAGLFALLHGNPWYFHLYYLLGLFLSWVYAVSRTLWIPITCHVINNAWTFINNALGVEYPLESFTGLLDLSLVAGGAILVLVFALGFKKASAKKAI